MSAPPPKRIYVVLSEQGSIWQACVLKENLLKLAQGDSTHVYQLTPPKKPAKKGLRKK